MPESFSENDISNEAQLIRRLRSNEADPRLQANAIKQAISAALNSDRPWSDLKALKHAVEAVYRFDDEPKKLFLEQFRKVMPAEIYHSINALDGPELSPEMVACLASDMGVFKSIGSTPIGRTSKACLVELYNRVVPERDRSKTTEFLLNEVKMVEEIDARRGMELNGLELRDNPEDIRQIAGLAQEDQYKHLTDFLRQRRTQRIREDREAITKGYGNYALYRAVVPRIRGNFRPRVSSPFPDVTEYIESVKARQAQELEERAEKRAQASREQIRVPQAVNAKSDIEMADAPKFSLENPPSSPRPAPLELPDDIEQEDRGMRVTMSQSTESSIRVEIPGRPAMEVLRRETRTEEFRIGQQLKQEDYQSRKGRGHG
jgi:hypothetical protein